MLPNAGSRSFISRCNKAFSWTLLWMSPKQRAAFTNIKQKPLVATEKHGLLFAANLQITFNNEKHVIKDIGHPKTSQTEARAHVILTEQSTVCGEVFLGGLKQMLCGCSIFVLKLAC